MGSTSNRTRALLGALHCAPTVSWVSCLVLWDVGANSREDDFIFIIELAAVTVREE